MTGKRFTLVQAILLATNFVLMVADVFNTDFLVSIDLKLEAMVQNVASYGLQSFFFDKSLLMSFSGSCMTIILKLETMDEKTTSYGVWLRSSKHNPRANVYCTLVPMYLYTTTSKSCQLWSLTFVAMIYEF